MAGGRDQIVRALELILRGKYRATGLGTGERVSGGEE